MTEIEQKAAAINDSLTAMKAEIAAKDEELKTAQQNIANLDESVRESAKTIDELKAELKAMKVTDKGWKAQFREVLDAARPEIEKKMQGGAQRFSVALELKTDIGRGAINSNASLSVQLDPEVSAAPAMPNAFLAAFGVAPRTADEISWVEASTTAVVDYVEELAANTNQSSVSFAQVKRQFGKLATYITISTEFTDWYEQLYQFCVGEGRAILDAKADEEVWKGAGSAEHPKKVYGIKGNSTAWVAQGVVDNPNIGDVINSAISQIAAAGHTANALFIGYGDEFVLKSVKDDNGNYIYDQTAKAYGQLRVFLTTRMNAGELLVADTTCAQPYAGNGFELEAVRDAAYDAWKVYFRRAVQQKIKTANKTGLVYVDSIEDAISDLATGGSTSNGAGA